MYRSVGCRRVAAVTPTKARRPICTRQRPPLFRLWSCASLDAAGWRGRYQPGRKRSRQVRQQAHAAAAGPAPGRRQVVGPPVWMPSVARAGNNVGSLTHAPGRDLLGRPRGPGVAVAPHADVEEVRAARRRSSCATGFLTRHRLHSARHRFVLRPSTTTRDNADAALRRCRGAATASGSRAAPSRQKISRLARPWAERS